MQGSILRNLDTTVSGRCRFESTVLYEERAVFRFVYVVQEQTVTVFQRFLKGTVVKFGAVIYDKAAVKRTLTECSVLCERIHTERMASGFCRTVFAICFIVNKQKIVKHYFRTGRRLDIIRCSGHADKIKSCRSKFRTGIRCARSCTAKGDRSICSASYHIYVISRKLKFRRKLYVTENTPVLHIHFTDHICSILNKSAVHVHARDSGIHDRKLTRATGNDTAVKAILSICRNSRFLLQDIFRSGRIEDDRFTDVRRANDLADTPTAKVLRAENILFHRAILDQGIRPSIRAGMSDNTADGRTHKLRVFDRAMIDQNLRTHSTVIRVVITGRPADHTADTGIFVFVRAAADQFAVHKMAVSEHDIRHTVNAFNKCARAKCIFTYNMRSKDRNILDYDAGSTGKATRKQRLLQPLDIGSLHIGLSQKRFVHGNGDDARTGITTHLNGLPFTRGPRNRQRRAGCIKHGLHFVILKRDMLLEKHADIAL